MPNGKLKILNVTVASPRPGGGGLRTGQKCSMNAETIFSGGFIWSRAHMHEQLV